MACKGISGSDRYSLDWQNQTNLFELKKKIHNSENNVLFGLEQKQESVQSIANICSASWIGWGSLMGYAKLSLYRCVYNKKSFNWHRTTYALSNLSFYINV